MPGIRHRTWQATAVAAAGTVAGLLALTGTAVAAPAPAAAHLPRPGKNLLFNSEFRKPGPDKNLPPTGWKLVLLGAEKKPYDASIDVYNAKGQYPPPKGNPNKSDIADEVFYEAGSATGVEGIGGQQTRAKFGSISQANNPQVSFSDVEHSAPEAKNAAWAGSGLQISFTSGKRDYKVIYLNLWTAYKSTFTKKPVSTATTKYVVGKTLKLDKWITKRPFGLNKSIKELFGLKTYRVTTVTVVDLEDTINSAYPYANMDGYFANLAITEGHS
jgi:hypothetical protein